MLSVNLQLRRPDFELNVDEQLALQGVTGIMGPSGCGKTTLLRCIAGLEKHAHGQVNFAGVEWQNGRQMVAPEQRRIGYVFQDGRLFPHLNVRDNLVYGRSRCGDRHGPQFDDVVDWLDIETLLERPVQSLSGGQRQRVAIGRALLGAPALLLMDEPLAALDWASRSAIMPRIRSLSEHFSVPVIFVSHDREEMARLTDELVLMEDGRVVERGRTRTLLSRSDGLLADSRAVAMLEAKVRRNDPAYGAAELDVDGRQLVVDRDNLEHGQRVRVVIPAAEVSLSLDPVERISIQNRLLTTLTDIRDIDEHHALAVLTLEQQSLLALVTRRARHQLGLRPGMPVYAHFKAACLDVV